MNSIPFSRSVLPPIFRRHCTLCYRHGGRFQEMEHDILMVIFYTLTTPFGIAIGILIQQSYNANATATLLSTGILDALSAGILIYDVLVNVVAPHFTADNFHNASPIFKFIQLVTMYMGCATMSLIGYWA
ncbi:hypothetical protein BASA62_000324 [Batrachochytrium salamandrivorans]|nr:hypothetical protein BASA62_000324 [Batrachochytrium salamandrivorans]